MIAIDQNLCTSCGACVPVCPRKILTVGEEGAMVLDPALCFVCGHCKAVCPTDAPNFPAMDGGEFTPVPGASVVPSSHDFLGFLRQRRSLRVYRDTPVEREKVRLIVEAGRFAPTGSNRQACAFTAVGGRAALDRVCSAAIHALQDQGREIRAALDRHARAAEPAPMDLLAQQALPAVWDRIAGKWAQGIDQLFHGAPALVVVHANQEIAPLAMIDAGIASAHMVLMAETLGLGTCYNGFLAMAARRSLEVREILGLPGGHEALATFSLGYPAVTFVRLVARNPARITWIGDFA
jgi:nitroreductase/NAD-dependent dihydropyrimidine dehydrogenase PreA subunit